MEAKTLRAAMRHLNNYANLILEHTHLEAGSQTPEDAQFMRREAKTQADAIRSVARELKAELPKRVMG